MLKKVTESGVKKLLGDSIAKGWNREQCKAWADAHPDFEWNPATGRCGAKKKTLREIGHANGKRLLSDMPPLPANRKKQTLSLDELAEYREGVRDAVLNQ